MRMGYLPDADTVSTESRTDSSSGMTATGILTGISIRDASVALAWVPEKRQVFAWRKVPLSDSAVVMAARCTRAPWSVRNTGRLNYRLSSHSHPNPEEHHG